MINLKSVIKPKTFLLESGKKVTAPRSAVPLILAALVLATYVSVRVTDSNLSILAKRGGQFFVIVADMFPPDWSYANAIFPFLVDTIVMSFLGSAIGALIAVPFAVLCASNVNENRALRQIFRFVFSIMRTVPTLILALIATYIFGIGTFVGTLAIGIFTLSIVVKMLYEHIETVDMGAFEALESIGATRTQAFVAAILPQILPTYFSIALYTFEVNIRYAAILGYVGAGGIGLILSEKLGWREYSKAGMVLALLFVTVIGIEAMSRYLRERFA